MIMRKILLVACVLAVYGSVHAAAIPLIPEEEYEGAAAAPIAEEEIGVEMFGGANRPVEQEGEPYITPVR